MRVASVELADFRSYPAATVALSPTYNLISGDNGQGKSNFLEAIGLLSIGRSVRGATDAEMVRWGASDARVACALADAGADRLAVILRPGERKEVAADGAPLAALSDLVGILRTVHLSPDVIDEQFRSPAGRRRMLDILISQVDHGYLDALKRHRTVVGQLNALWKRPDPSAVELDAWEHQLAEVAVAIIARRRQALAELDAAARTHFATLFGANRLDTRMRSTLPFDEESDPVATAVAALWDSRPQAARCGFVTRGAHRDRIDVLIDGREIESHASQGQIKGAYFAGKLAEGDYIAGVTGDGPVWLVDDPFSEMDRTRALQVLEAFRDRGQVVLTTARDGDLGLDALGFARWQVRDGVIDAA